MITLKKIGFLLLFAGVFTMVPVINSGATTSEEENETNETIGALASDMEALWVQMSTIQATAVFDELDLAAQQWDALQTSVNGATSLSTILPNVADAFDVVAQKYQSIANMSNTIESEKASVLAGMDEVLASAQSEKSLKEDEKAALVAQKSQKQTQLMTETDQTQISILNNEIAALDSQISSKQQTIDRWAEFITLVETTRDDLISFDNSLDILLAALNSNAGVYISAAESIRAAAELAAAEAAMDSLAGTLADVDTITAGIVSSWNNINTLVDQIGSL